jgi:hypothetical protein
MDVNAAASKAADALDEQLLRQLSIGRGRKV